MIAHRWREDLGSATEADAAHFARAHAPDPTPRDPADYAESGPLMDADDRAVSDAFWAGLL